MRTTQIPDFTPVYYRYQRAICQAGATRIKPAKALESLR
jgi:hypothetical protein